MSAKYTAAEVAAAVALSAVSAKDWHTVALTVVKRKLGIDV